MNEKKLRQIGLRIIKKLENYSAEGRSRLTCFLFVNRLILKQYRDFLLKEGILTDTSGSIRNIYFLPPSSNTNKDYNVQANLFRMMVITEFFKRMGVEL
jgi:hypothetical protein